MALFAFCASLAVWTDGQFRQAGRRPHYYQEYFAPAVMFACGDGFHNVEWSADPALSGFLLQKRDTLACGDIGRGLVAAPLEYFQRMSLYLEWSVAITWRLAGLSWGAVTGLKALLAGLFGAAMYGVMRLGMRPVAAAIFSVIVVTSPLHLSNVPPLRDYSKAPFLLLLVLLTGIIVQRTLPRRHLLWLSALGGFVAGVGFGFRTDLLLGTIPFLVALFVFRAGPRSTRARLTQGALAAAVFVASFAVTAAPVLGRYAKGGAIAHVMLLGFGGSFSSALGVEAKHYELYTPYNDEYQQTVVRSAAIREGQPFVAGATEYDRASSRYLMDVIGAFPADVAIRGLGAVAQILDARFPASYARDVEWVDSPGVRSAFIHRGQALDFVAVTKWAAAVIVIAGVAFWSVRRAAFLVFMVVVLAGGAAIQFAPRHFFYLEFMPLWAVGVMLDRVAAAGRAIVRLVTDGAWRTRETIARVGLGVARSAAVVVAIVLTTTVALGATRHFQQRSVERLFDRILSADAKRLTIATVPNGADRVTMTVDLPELERNPEFWQSGTVGTAYLLVDVNPMRCDALYLSALVRYDGSQHDVFNSSVTVPLIVPQLPSSVRILVPVYRHFDTRFSGIDVPRHLAGCVSSISKITELGSFPILVTAILGPDWRDAWHYQTMSGVERREDGALWHQRLYEMPQTPEIGRSVFSTPLIDIWPDAVMWSRTAVRVAPSGMAVAGTPESPYGYLVGSRERAVSRGSCAVAEGALTSGGLTFGILRNGQWYHQVNIVERGQFMAVGCVQEDGNYSVLLANDNPAEGVTAAAIERMGWVKQNP